jgi:acyl-CoA thioesterase FadM
MLRNDVQYLNEVHLDSEVSTYFRILNISKSKKRLHFYFYMINGNQISSISEGIMAFANLKLRKLESFPPEIFEKLNNFQQMHQQLNWKHEPNLKFEE